MEASLYKPISRLVRSAIAARLAAPNYGYNAQIAAAAGHYGLQAEQFQVDFHPESTSQFFEGHLTPADVLDSSELVYPVIVLKATRSGNKNLRKFGMFSGDVMAEIEIYLSWPDERVPRDAANASDLIEEIVFRMFNEQSPREAIWNPGRGLIWNGDLDFTPGALAHGAGNWEQLLRARLVLEVEV